jgi:hypothetical protein
MSIIVDGTLNTIKRDPIPGDKVIFLNALYINGKKYVFASDTESDAEMDPYQKIHKTTFKMTYLGDPRPSDSNIVYIKGEGEINNNNEIISSGRIVASDGTSIAEYTIIYTRGTRSNKALIDFAFASKDVVAKLNDNVIKYIELQQVKGDNTAPDQATITFEYTYNLPVIYTEAKELSQIQEYDNLLVPGDMLVNNNLEVGGPINDLTLYYDTIYTDSLTTDLGFGMYALFYNSKYTLDNVEYTLPFFQLSPGLSHATDTIEIL